MNIDSMNPEKAPESVTLNTEEIQIEEILLREEKACSCLCSYNEA